DACDVVRRRSDVAQRFAVCLGQVSYRRPGVLESGAGMTAMRTSLLPYAHQMSFLSQRLGAAVLIAVAATVSAAADVPVYRCNTGNGAMLYTDQPCADGQRLDIQPAQALTSIPTTAVARASALRSATSLRGAATLSQ